MSGFWNEKSSQREFKHQRPCIKNRYDNQQQFNFGYETSNFFRFPSDRSRSRNSYLGDNNSNYANRNCRGRGWGRRSASAPRTAPAEDRGRWNPNRGYNRSRKKSISSDMNDEKIDCENKLKDSVTNQEKDTPQVPQVKKFRSIFGPESKSTNPKVLKTSDINHQIDHIITSINLEMNTEPPDISDKNGNIQNIYPNSVELRPNSRKVYLKPSQKNELTEYYGESLTDLMHEELKLQITQLPIVDWPKKSFIIDNIPEYDPSVSVGGEGLTVEVYYLCKYCKMFTGGSQIDAHLKSRYHYNKYKEFLRTGHIASESSSSSSESSSECDSKTSKSPKKQVPTQPTNQSSMDIDDPSEIEYSCHQDLDFD